MQDIVLAAARRIAEGNDPVAGRVISLAQVLADPDVRVHVNTAARVIDIMNELACSGRVYMICRHPEPRWRVNPEREG